MKKPDISFDIRLPLLKIFGVFSRLISGQRNSTDVDSVLGLKLMSFLKIDSFSFSNINMEIFSNHRFF